MKTYRIIPVVLTTCVILGIVGCSKPDPIISDDTEFTSQVEETTEETTELVEPSVTPTATATPKPTVTPKPTEGSGETEETLGESTETTITQESGNAQTESLSTVNETQAEPAEQQPVAPQASTATQTPTPTPSPTATPVPTATPTPEPVAIDIEASAQANGYVAIDIDMGNGTTQRIYGYYVDMSGLDSMVNDYRESIGLPRLPADTDHVSEMRLRAAEATVTPGHWRPNGQLGSEANYTSYVSVEESYNAFYNSDSHREWWEEEYVYSIYSVGFRRMVFDESTGTWSGGGSATVQYFG